MLISLSFVFYLSYVVRFRANGHECITPNATAGVCVERKYCRIDSEFFDSTIPDNYVYQRQSQCGYSIKGSIVCCPKNNTFGLFHTQLPTGNKAETYSKLPEPPNCGTGIDADRIIGGEMTAIDEFPWMVLLEYGIKKSFQRGFACGGVLINSRYVLTAAHCATGETEQLLGGLVSVRLGEHNISSSIDCDTVAVNDCAPAPMDVAIEEKIIHPEFKNNQNQYHDIALLKLVKHIEFNDFISPICLAKQIPNTIFNNKRWHYVSGWGQTEKGTSSAVKLKLKIPIVSPKTCGDVYTRFNVKLGKGQLCAGGEGKKDSCIGDSGGPLMIPLIIPKIGPVWFCTGIVSIGPQPCAQANIPGIYTKVTDYYDWIVENIT